VLDRDGVINEDLWGYVTKKEEFKPIEGSLLAIKKLTDAGFSIVIATNQACISKKIINEKQLQAVHDHMSLLVQEAGGKIDHVAFCPHTPEEKCSCRKPETGLLDEIEERLGCSLKNSFFIQLGIIHNPFSILIFKILINFFFGVSFFNFFFN